MTENNQKPPRKCPKCGHDVVEKKGTSQKTGKKYHFFGCSNFPECNWTWSKPKSRPKRTESGKKIMQARDAKENVEYIEEDQSTKERLERIENALIKFAEYIEKTL